MNNRTLYRDPHKAVFGGVAAGLANYFDLDLLLMRIICFVLFFVTGIFPFFLAYIIMWAALPKATSTTIYNDTNFTINQPITMSNDSNKRSNGTQLAGYILVAIGSLIFLNKFFGDLHLGRYIPSIVLIGVGAYLIFKNDGWSKNNDNSTTNNYGPKTFEDTKAAETLPNDEK